MSRPAPGGWVRARGLAQIESGRPAHVDVAGYTVCLVHAAGTVYACRDESSHESVLLSGGGPADSAIERSPPSSRLEPAAGWVLSPPPTRPAAALAVRVDGSDIYIHLPPGRREMAPPNEKAS